MNFKKCSLEPTQEIQYLDIVVNAKAKTLFSPPENVAKNNESVSGIVKNTRNNPLLIYNSKFQH